jgi:hypothetical protein
MVGELAAEAPVVVEATLTSATSKTSGRFTVQRWFKGSGPNEIEITGFGYGSDCRSPMFRERSLIFLSVAVDGTYSLREPSTYAGVRPPTKENIEAIVRTLAASHGSSK